MDRAAIESLVRKSYENRRKNDVQATLACFHPQAVFHLSGPESIAPVTKRLMGHAEIGEAFKGMFEAWDWSNFPIESILIDGDRVAVHCKGTLKFTPTGKTIDTQIVDLIRVKDGVIVDFIEFCDTLSAAQMMGMIAA
jgi:ketosteroid isomerase-like protein